MAKLGFEIKAVTDNSNGLLQQLAELNSSISKATALGHDTATLLDNRERAVQQLAGFIQLDVMPQADGTIQIATSNGAPLLMSDRAATLTVAGTSVSLQFNNQQFAVPATTGGSLGGLLKVQAEVLTPARQDLSSLVQNIATSVNSKLAGRF